MSPAPQRTWEKPRVAVQYLEQTRGGRGNGSVRTWCFCRYRRELTSLAKASIIMPVMTSNSITLVPSSATESRLTSMSKSPPLCCFTRLARAARPERESRVQTPRRSAASTVPDYNDIDNVRRLTALHLTGDPLFVGWQHCGTSWRSVVI